MPGPGLNEVIALIKEGAKDQVSRATEKQLEADLRYQRSLPQATANGLARLPRFPGPSEKCSPDSINRIPRGFMAGKSRTMMADRHRFDG